MKCSEDVGGSEYYPFGGTVLAYSEKSDRRCCSIMVGREHRAINDLSSVLVLELGDNLVKMCDVVEYAPNEEIDPQFLSYKAFVNSYLPPDACISDVLHELMRRVEANNSVCTWSPTLSASLL